MKPVALLLALVTIGCGAPFAPKQQCDSSEFKTIWLESGTRSCEDVAPYVDFAVQFLKQKGAVPADFSFKDVEIYVNADFRAECHGVTGQGCYVSEESFIALGNALKSAAHEALHRYEDKMKWGTPEQQANHTFWPERHWFDLDTEFKKWITATAPAP